MESCGTAVGSTAARIERSAGEHVIGRGAARLALDAEPGRGVALRVEVDDQHMLADGGSAVPRLMAVVVLPTPPFWLAIASTRGRPPSAARLSGLREGDDLGMGRLARRSFWRFPIELTQVLSATV